MKKVNYDKIGKGLSGVGTFIGNNKKPLLYIGGAIAVVVVGVALVKRFTGAIEGKDIKGGKFNIQDIDEAKSTISNATAKNYAELLYEASNYQFGTDKSIIESVFSKINSEDFKKVYNAFGKRSYSNGISGGKPSQLQIWLGDYEDLDLIGWLNNELGFGDSALKNKIRPIIEGAGFVLEK